jgi:hypothetical protein
MDPFDYKEDVHPARRISTLIFNVLTALFLLGTVCVAGLLLILLINPASGINPYPPATLPSLVGFPTATPTPRIMLPATWTPTSPSQPTNVPTDTAIPTETQMVEVTSTPEPQSEPTESGGMPYVLQQGDPVAIPNIGHPDAGCNWMGVAGQATGLNGAPVVGLFVQLEGTLAGNPEDQLGMTGTATQYGQAGYEFYLGDKPLDSQNTLWVQLFDQAMLPLSDKIYFSTYADCQRNLIFINFNQIR